MDFGRAVFAGTVVVDFGRVVFAGTVELLGADETGFESTAGADSTGPAVVEGAIEVDWAVAVSAGVAPLSPVVQPANTTAINAEAASLVAFLIGVPMVELYRSW